MVLFIKVGGNGGSTLQAIPLEGEDKRARIEQAALSLFLQNGIENTSVNQITKQAQIAKGTFYLYFKDKDELVRNSFIHENLKTLDQALRQSQNQSSRTGLSWTSCFVTALMDFYEQHPQILCFVQKNKDLCAFSSFLESDALLADTPCIRTFLSGLSTPRESKKLARMRFLMIMDILTSVSYLLYSGGKSENRESLRTMALDIVGQICGQQSPGFLEEEIK